ncbi:MAG: hypothetical protein ACFBSE_25640 [Prochloraceae cyanobacterium]
MTKTPQQKWNERNPEKMLELNRRFAHRHKQIAFRISKEEDKDLVDWYDNLSKEEKNNLLSSIVDFMKEYKERSNT